MQDLTWIDIKEQRIPKWIDNMSRVSGRSFVKSFLVINRDHGPIVHACWFLPYERGSTDHKIRSYPHNRPFDMQITHWCIPSRDPDDWNAIKTLERYPGTTFLAIDTAGVIKHVYVNKNGHLGLVRGGTLKSKLVGWLNVPKFED